MEWKVVVQMLCHAAGKQQEKSSQWAELEIQRKEKGKKDNHRKMSATQTMRQNVHSCEKSKYHKKM